MEDLSILIVGAGAAGLAAARTLSAHHIPVTILEARDRPGGRIYTIASSVDSMPIELGAEFVHGARNRTWDLLRRAKLKTHEVPDRHWLENSGHLVEEHQFWEQLEEVMEKIDPAQKDTDFESLLAALKGIKDSAKWLAREYVEGFHAAPANCMSIKALAKSEAASEKTEGSRQFRLTAGYHEFVQCLLNRVEQADVKIHYRAVVKEIRWEHGRVEMRTANGPKPFCGSHALITVPLGVLKAAGDGLTFQPQLDEKRKAISALEMGEVVKVTLQFHSRFWPVANFGFIHSKQEWLPTWWADERGAILTGWAGGPRATKLSKEHPDSIIAEACRALGGIFKVEKHQIEELLAASYIHNWTADPFSQGAYSFTPAGLTKMLGQLAHPVADTLFFAGEATDANGEQGTVHGALASGERAAREIIASRRHAVAV